MRARYITDGGLETDVETDGRLPDGTTLRDAIARVDAEAAPDYFVVNCATHISPGLISWGEDTWLARIEGLRPNASRMSHAELDEARSSTKAIRTSSRTVSTR